MNQKVRILLADDHDLIREGLRTVIQAHPDWHVCGEARTGAEAINLARKLKPDVVVLDIGMSELNGLGAARKIHEELPQTEILMLSIHMSDALVKEALTVGARGYVLKTDAKKLLVIAIETLLRHKPFLSSEVSQLIVDQYLQGTGREIPDRLTPREKEIVQLLAEGKTSKEVAMVLNISVKTAETHRANIMRKLELGSFADLVRYAVRNRIVEL